MHEQGGENFAMTRERAADQLAADVTHHAPNGSEIESGQLVAALEKALVRRATCCTRTTGTDLFVQTTVCHFNASAKPLTQRIFSAPQNASKSDVERVSHASDRTPWNIKIGPTQRLVP